MVMKLFCEFDVDGYDVFGVVVEVMVMFSYIVGIGIVLCDIEMYVQYVMVKVKGY